MLLVFSCCVASFTCMHALLTLLSIVHSVLEARMTPTRHKLRAQSQSEVPNQAAAHPASVSKPHGLIFWLS